MNVPTFRFEGMPRLVFGDGTIGTVAELAAQYGRRVLLVTGQRSFARATALFDAMHATGLELERCTVSGEPSPALVDEAVKSSAGVDVVVAVGGGAVVDAGKAISAMLPAGKPVRDYLEGVGAKKPSGEKIPFIACPTSAGTGAEATKNAVLSEVGPRGFKKSLRHQRYIPDAVVIDPDLAVSCPREVTAACGLDALTQLLEAFVSKEANPASDAFARSGLLAASGSLLRVCGEGAGETAARAQMAWAAFCSGVALAHAGLGVVHGLASPLGGFYRVPHGVVCGTLLPAATEVNVRRAVKGDGGDGTVARYAEVGRLLSGEPGADDETACRLLVDTLWAWKRHLGIPPLSAFGVGVEDKVLDATGLKQNPVPLATEDLRRILLDSGANPTC
ncbi:iron-containing alcohol dehydrogenase [Planctomycetota bacterium]